MMLSKISFLKLLVAILLLELSLLTGLSSQELPYLDSTLSVEERVEDLLSRMSLDEKIGQMIQIDLKAVRSNPSIITNYYIGSVLSGGDSDPASGNYPEDWANVYDTMQVYALKTPLKIPILYGVDAVHGHNNVIGTTIFPHNIGMGCTRNPELVKEAAKITAKEMAATGLNWTFAPCIAVPQDERWGRTYEGYGETAELVQIMGTAAVKGFQGDSLSDPLSVLACAKHYLADGGTKNGIDQGDAQIDTTTLRSIHLPGYISAIDSGVGSVMVSYNSINGNKMHGSKYWITNVLKGELNFKGIVVSDWDGILQLSSDFKKCVDSAINAGIDMVMLSSRYNDFKTAMQTLYSEGKITIDRINDAVRRILTIKFRMALFERPFANRALMPLVGSIEHRTLARQCVRESIVLLKKKDGILPLPKNGARILVAGTHANNIGYQCGGWTISWQGGSGEITTGTTILEGMRNKAPGDVIEYSINGEFTDTTANYVIVVVGETPYAEGTGDRTDLSLSKSNVELIKRVKNFGKPVILILISGRPLIIDKILHYADVIIAAWLPGTEGEGIADILFGDFQPKGLLSYSWPRNMTQIPINFGDIQYSPLYHYGYGITSLEDSPVGSAPVYLSAIITKDGQHIEITFNKKMKDPSGRTAIFEINKNGILLTENMSFLLKENDSTTIVIKFDSILFKNKDNITISYVSGNIESFDGGILDSFGPVNAFNWVSPIPISIPRRIEAEDFCDMLGVDVKPTNDINGGYHIENIDAGDWLEFALNVSKTGYYYITMRYASESSIGKVGFVIYNVSIPKVINLYATGSLDNWYTSTPSIAGFYAGQQILRMNVIQGGFRLNWFSIDSVKPALVTDNISCLPVSNELEQNYPNPFNGITNFSYSIIHDGIVKISVFNILGQEIKVLTNEYKKAGKYKTQCELSDYTSGIYFYRIQASSFSDVKKMILIK